MRGSLIEAACAAQRVSAVTDTSCAGKVLLIDDDTRLLEMVGLHLEDAGYQVVIAECASLGLAVAGAAVQAMEVQTLLQVVLQAAASAARILG